MFYQHLPLRKSAIGVVLLVSSHIITTMLKLLQYIVTHLQTPFRTWWIWGLRLVKTIQLHPMTYTTPRLPIQTLTCI